MGLALVGRCLQNPLPTKSRVVLSCSQLQQTSGTQLNRKVFIMNQEPKKPLSPQKLAANRANAQHSTGPKTDAGKAKAAQNSWKHGVLANCLYPTNELRAQDANDFKLLYTGLWQHYSPVGFLEQQSLEKIAVLEQRLTRLLRYEQKVFDYDCRLICPGTDRVVRYETSLNRQLAKEIEKLERLQQQRKAKQDESDPAYVEPDDTASEPEAACDELPEPPKDSAVGQPAQDSPSANTSEPTPTITDPNPEATAEQGLTATDATPSTGLAAMIV
jgi:hypothetical protein